MFKNKDIKHKLDLINKKLEAAGNSENKGVKYLMENIDLSKGKRIRGLLVLLTAQLNGEKDTDTAADTAAAMELLHHATLIHDDILDNSEKRRGEKSLFKMAGYQMSVLGGDYLFANAASLLIKQQNLKLYTVMFDGIKQICEGEIEEVYNENNPLISPKQYFDIIRSKTASLIRVSVQAGAVLAGISGKNFTLLSDFGTEAGMAFQIKDDILDITSDETKLGKPVGSDIKEGKATLPLIMAMQNAGKGIETAAICRVFENGKAAENTKNIIEFIQKYRGIEAAEEAAAIHIKAAKKNLRGVSVKNADALKRLEEMAVYMFDRKN